MHVEFLVEDSSGEKLLATLLPKLLESPDGAHSWRVHAYRGIGRLPSGLAKGGDPAKRILLDQLPRLLRGYGRTKGVDAVVVMLDSDGRDCAQFLAELNTIVHHCRPAPKTLFRLAIEEMEAWYFGDRTALLQAYPRARQEALDRYRQDAVCGTWEMLADAIYPGGAVAIRNAGWPLPGQVKSEWAARIGPVLQPDRNSSPSFGKFCDGVRRLLV